MSTYDIVDRAFVLHSRNYRESSLLLKLLCRRHGLLSAVAKGVRAKKQSHQRVLLQTFQPLNIELKGRSELKVLTACEATISDSRSYFETTNAAAFSQPQRFACASYLNEIILRALQEAEPHPALFDSYQLALSELLSDNKYGLALRRVELALLAELGSLPSFSVDQQEQPIEPENMYFLGLEQAFVKVSSGGRQCYSGRNLLAIGEGRLEQAEAVEVQQIMRQLLRPLIGDKPLQSRKLWQHMS